MEVCVLGGGGGEFYHLAKNTIKMTYGKLVLQAV